MDDASGTACRSRAEIVLLDQKSSSSGRGALSRNRHAVNAATDHDDLVVRSVKWASCCGGCDHKTGEARTAANSHLCNTSLMPSAGIWKITVGQTKCDLRGRHVFQRLRKAAASPPLSSSFFVVPQHSPITKEIRGNRTPRCSTCNARLEWWANVIYRSAFRAGGGNHGEAARARRVSVGPRTNL